MRQIFTIQRAAYTRLKRHFIGIRLFRRDVQMAVIVEDSHPAIIPPEEFELVQAEMIRRKSAGREYSGSSPFSSKIICSCCDGFYGAKVWHSGSKYQRTIWQCNHKFQNNENAPRPIYMMMTSKKIPDCLRKDHGA